MNKFKREMTSRSNRTDIERELRLIQTNQRIGSPMTNNVLGQIYKMHYTTFRKLQIFKSTSWYTQRFKLVYQKEGTFILFTGDDVKKLANDSTAMLMRIKADNNAIKQKVLSEYPVASWISSEAQRAIIKMALDDMDLDIIQVVSEDRCILFYNSRFHGNERLKAEYYFRTRRILFDISA